jgi:hypothetical protein
MMYQQRDIHHHIHLIRTGALAVIGVALGGAAMAQQWNEVPAPSGKEAVSRTYPAPYRTDVIDVRVRGSGGEIEYMIQMKAGDTVVYAWEVQNFGDLPH